jgi:ABC-2 type transport system permease protein
MSTMPLTDPFRGRPPVLDLTATPRVPLGRLVGVELRKLVDTRAGTLAADHHRRDHRRGPHHLLPGRAAVGPHVRPVHGRHGRAAGLLAAAPGDPAGDRRMVPADRARLVHPGATSLRVLAAKVLATLLAGAAAIATALAVAAAATLVAGSSTGWDGVTAATLGKFAILQTSWLLEGLAFGLLFLSSAPAIVTYLVLPQAFTMVAQLWTGLDQVRP